MVVDLYHFGSSVKDLSSEYGVSNVTIYKWFKDLTPIEGISDKVEPIPVEQIKTIIETQLNDSIEKLFTNFDEQPLASASIAQVHKATLLSGEEVVLKVLKPNLKKLLKVDIHILKNFANLLANRATWARNIDIINLTEGFIQNLHEEVDFTIELKNTK